MIYAIRAVGTPYIKFGVAVSVKKRLETLQIGCPLELELLASCDGSTPEEAFIHWTLMQAKAHHRGEWFKQCREADEIIAAMRSNAITAKPAPTKLIQIANRKLRIPEAEKAYRLREVARRPAVLARARGTDPVAARRQERAQWWFDQRAKIDLVCNEHTVKLPRNAPSEEDQCVA